MTSGSDGAGERDWRTLTVLRDAGEVTRALTALRPRDCVFVVYDVTDAAIATPAVARLDDRQRLLAGIASQSVLREAVLAGSDPAGAVLTGYLGDCFPPRRDVPVLSPYWMEVLRAIGLGVPGEPVAHGLFPSVPSKLARLAVARSGGYPAALVRDAAVHAYDGGRPYDAHDAVAAALVHPGVDAEEVAAEITGAIAAEIARALAARTRSVRGRRSRRKTHALLAWAHRAGYLR